MAADPKYSALEKSLNSDAKLRAAFIKDPAKIIKEHGLEMNSEMASAVHSQIAALKIPEHPGPEFRFPHIHISIVIRVSAD
jgi:hypothetical protein